MATEDEVSPPHAGHPVPAPDADVDVRLWGKERRLPSAYPLICHLLDTAAVAGALWDVVLTPQVRQRLSGRLGWESAACRRLLCFWAGLHDIGKITPPFQAVAPALYNRIAGDAAYEAEAGAESQRLRHDLAAHWALTALFAELGYPQRGPLARSVHHQVAQLLGGHHGCFHEVLEKAKLKNAAAWVPGLGGRGWEEQRRAHAAVVRRLTGVREVPESRLPAEAIVVFAGLVIVADWLASQEHVIMPRLPAAGWSGTDAELAEHWRSAVAQAPGIVREARLGTARFPHREFAQQFPFPPNDLQASLAAELPGLATGPGLLLITAPTGDGKTEAALHAATVMARAAGAGGVYFALPTMATADAMYLRVRDFAERNVEGDRALTLLHSMAWLSAAYAPQDDGPAESAVVSDHTTELEAGSWLRAHNRGLIAPLGAGTVDYPLTAVLPVRYNVLRLLGLAGKVVVVDEAHAYGPWMHSLLVRLLEWLGALRAPVVLLSATLTGRTASSLVEAYRRGCGFRDPAGVEPCYPGWLYVDAASGEVSRPRKVASDRARVLSVEVEPVRWDGAEDPQAAVRPGARRAALLRHLQPLVADGGCALVCCTTVDEAQRTYRFLQAQFPDLARAEGELLLLHSRYPAWRREELAAYCEERFGKPRRDGAAGRRPRRAILVATQVVEQSLDLDFDLIISDLAPLAQLLQRAGRAWRHERDGRPAWVGSRPRLVVLEPVDREGRTEPPRTWGAVYDASLLLRTSELLLQHGGAIDVPGDVQALIDRVYADDFGDHLEEAAQRELKRHDAEREAGAMAEKHLAGITTIPAPYVVSEKGDLALISGSSALVDPALLTTRLGADSERAVCAYVQAGDSLTLDPEGAVPLPGTAGGRLTRDQVAQVMRHTVPLPGRWLTGRGSEQEPLPSWSRSPALARLALLRLRRGADGRWTCRVGGYDLELSDVGLSRN
ncbi:CRISPR-associated endonuclease Cas3'' [Streptomyces sp. WAC00469]|uniref:CRISPR-associated endonuclease Cas3'' n=1 Tax=Streptomyces sp. WAC00469 TaxID=2487415 RepID=UPI000F747846|nr:CRISPR-associated endonuclease Cas3'' [Streptomyces sp. WAC00469]RSR99036.1 CRISPR-associated endonuclease Cas3'' [Streptomyces sp. WAC00469]